VGLSWQRGKVTQARVRAATPHRLAVRMGSRTVTLDVTPDWVKVGDG
jgi:hypothetical protein